MKIDIISLGSAGRYRTAKQNPQGRVAEFVFITAGLQLAASDNWLS